MEKTSYLSAFRDRAVVSSTHENINRGGVVASISIDDSNVGEQGAKMLLDHAYCDCEPWGRLEIIQPQISHQINTKFSSSKFVEKR